jgi:hypothetical protein
MKIDGAPLRRKYTSCRHWYHPSPTAKTQQTCSKRCRCERRRKLAKQRRRKDLAGYRAEDRARQQSWREANASAAGGLSGAATTRLSRATFAPEVAVLYDEIVEDWDKIMNLSRARFERKIAVLLGRNGPKLGQDGTEAALCHAPA